MHTPSRWTPAVALIIVLIGCASCKDASRPALADWEPTWRELSSRVHTSARAGESISAADCESLLAAARQAGAELLPSPDQTLQTAVEDWVVLGESIGASCQAHPDLRLALDDLANAERRVNAAAAAIRPTK